MGFLRAALRLGLRVGGGVPASSVKVRVRGRGRARLRPASSVKGDFIDPLNISLCKLVIKVPGQLTESTTLGLG